MNLYDYVANIATRVAREKAAKGQAPTASLEEIKSEADDDILECMRSLHRSGTFTGSRDSRGTPILTLNDNKKHAVF